MIDFINVRHTLSQHVLDMGNYNSYGYRCPEFDRVDFNESVVMFGCSYCSGIGLTDEETISYKLSEKLNLPVINMGINGGSISMMWMLSTILREKKFTPKAIILMYTAVERVGLFIENKLRKVGAWDLDNESIYKQTFLSFSEDTNARLYSTSFKNSIHQSWNNITPIIEASIFEHTSKILDIELLSQIDYARDNRHSGVKTAEKIANFLYERITNA